MRMRVHLSVLGDVIGKSKQTLRVIRNGTGGQFALYRVAAAPGRTPTSMIDLEEALTWCRRVVRPWTPEMEQALIVSAQPEGQR
jgi:hypothetical protein